MAETALYDRSGAQIGTVELPDELFGQPVNSTLIHQAVVAQLAGRRVGTHATKTRGEVAGGGRKPYRQKGTGRARQGSIRAPHYRGGGTVFGPTPRSYAQKLPKKMRRAALAGALSAKLGDSAIKVVDSFALPEIRTRDFLSVLEALEATGRVLVVAPVRDDKLVLSARNLPAVEVILADSLNVVEVMKADTVLIEQAAIGRMTEVYA